MRGRCRATNLCGYCSKLAAVEVSEMLAVDAMTAAPPSVWAVLTTRSTDPDPSRYARSIEHVWRAVKRRWPTAEYACFVEFTTGYGPRSGGHRRPHWNLLLKGVAVDDLVQLAAVISSVWCAREDARSDAQHVGSVYAEGGLMRYLALHFQKSSQMPPAGWSGHRFRSSRGYFAAGRQATRERAQRQLRVKRARRAIALAAEEQGCELTGEELWEFAGRDVELAQGVRWKLVEGVEQLQTAMRAPGTRAVVKATGDGIPDQERPPEKRQRASRRSGVAAPPSVAL